jgi:glycosyltransferase involved in cell wall biosynthesis
MESKQQYFRQYREKMIRLINENVDTVLTTSKRVEKLCLNYGIHEDKIRTLYIGTKFAGNQLLHSCTSDNDSPFRIIYLGYMREDKGFYFFLDTLECLPVDLAEKLEVVVAAKAYDRLAVNRIKQLGQNNFLRKITLYNGYTHDSLKELLKDIHLGIVPVLWEDNLPQIAIEMKAMGVPVLSSNLGGASELTEADNFTFEAGSSKDLIKKLSYFAEDKTRLQDYWNPVVPLKTIQQHIEELEKAYFE